MGKPTFHALAAHADFVAEAARFRSRPATPIPVWTGPRDDLAESVARAGELYQGAAPPVPADLGVVLSPGIRDELRDLLEPLARRWLILPEAVAELGDEAAATLLVVGLHQDLDWRPVRDLLLLSYRSPALRLSFLSGRDRHSLAWMVAKQWTALLAGVEQDVFLSAIDAPPAAADLLVLGERDFANEDVRQLVLGRRWRRVLFQGHGKDDNINLGDFTVCGRNSALPDRIGSLRPRCGYGLPCFKDETKLIPLHEVRAAELVMSACNSGPLAAMALYDGKYMLLLSAIDGCFRSIVTAVSVHDADRPENRLWSSHRGAGSSVTAPLLNDSLRWQQPYPAFWHFGMPDAAPAAHPPTPRPQLDGRISTVAERLHCLLTSDLLPSRHRLRGRLETLNRKLNRFLDRAQRDQAGLTEVLSDLLAVDVSMAQLINQRPEDPLMDFASYFGARSRLDEDSVAEVACTCGFPAQRFLRRGLAHGILDTVCVLCLRCGDKVFRFLDAPALSCTALDRVEAGATLGIRAHLDGLQRGMVQVGLFVPVYLRQAVRATPGLQRLRAQAGQAATVDFAIGCDPQVAPQGYYFTVFCIQDLGISLCRQHFAVLPLPTTRAAAPQPGESA
jgi:hypothetical protein